MHEQDIQERFQHVPPDENRRSQHVAVRAVIRDAAHSINQMQGGESREKSLAMTHLEEALMWANAHIARNVPDERS